MAQGVEVVAPRYLDGFRCIGAACENDCCHGWRVFVDQGAYRALKKSLDGSKQGREEFRQAIKRNRSDQKGAASYATIGMRDDGACPFLDDQKLCTVHGRFGDEKLSQTCRDYPRLLSQFGERIEMNATISCPEVARRCLLEEGSMDLVSLTYPFGAGGILRKQQLPMGARDPYLLYLDEIRQVGLQLLGAPARPLSARLFLLACFADGLTPFFFRGTTNFSEDLLAEEIGQVADPAMLAEAEAGFAGIDSRIDFAMKLVQVILQASALGTGSDFSRLLERVFQNGGGSLQGGVDFDAEGQEAVFQAFYQRRKGWLEGHYARRIDTIFANYCSNYWLGEWYVHSTSVAEHARRLFVQQSVLRFLLYCHPGLNDLIEAEVCDDETTLDRVAVEVFHLFSRGIEHNQQFLKSIQNALSKEGLEELVLQTLLLKF